MTTKIPLDGSAAQSSHVMSACRKMNLPHELKVTHGNSREMYVQVEYEDGAQMFLLGVKYFEIAVKAAGIITT